MAGSTWCTDVSWVWHIPNLNAIALLYKHKQQQVNRLLHHQGSRVLPHNLWCPELLHQNLKYNSAPSCITKEPEYYTEVPKYYTTKAPEYFSTTYAAPAYYTEGPNYYNTQVLHYNLHCPELLHRRPEVLLCVKGVV
jgi:hypothetical protein